MLTPYRAHKLHPKTIPCVFLGYPTNSKGYLCLNPVTYRLYISRHVLFNESVFPGLKHPNDTSISPAISQTTSATWLNKLMSLHTCSHYPQVNPNSSVEQSPMPTGPSTASFASFPILADPIPADLLTLPDTPITPLPTSPYISPISLPTTATHVPLPTPISVSLNISHVSLPTAATHVPLPTAIFVPSLSPLSNLTHPAVPNFKAAPLPPVTHPMQTQSKSGIFKPKLGYKAQIDYSITEPTSFTTASKHL